MLGVRCESLRVCEGSLGDEERERRVLWSVSLSAYAYSVGSHLCRAHHFLALGGLGVCVGVGLGRLFYVGPLVVENFVRAAEAEACAAPRNRGARAVTAAAAAPHGSRAGTRRARALALGHLGPLCQLAYDKMEKTRAR